MRPAIVAAVHARGKNFLPVPQSVADINDLELFTISTTRNGTIEFRRVDEEDKKE